MVGLGDFAGGAFSSRAAAVDGDGALIVGRGESADGPEAAVWDTSLAIARVADFLAAHGVTVPAGWRLTEATGVTVMGSTISIAGNGTNPSGDPEGWVARSCAE